MKYQASEIYGFALHWAVAQVFGLDTALSFEGYPGKELSLQAIVVRRDGVFTHWYSYDSSELRTAINRMKISVNHQPENDGWIATSPGSTLEAEGEIMFEAIARLIVLNSFPDGLEVPEELKFCCFK